MAVEYSTLARPYAKAAFECALADGELASWSAFLQTVAHVTNDERVEKLLKNPYISEERQVAFYEAIAQSVMQEKHKNFIRLLADNKRLPVLPEVASIYERLRAEQEKTIEVDVISFLPLESEQEAKLAAALTKRLNRDVTIRCHVDESILGGAIVQAGDLVIDGSAKGKLEKLKQALVA